ncbi:hypothetical protein [Burkholderia stabilis]|uniref:hypothetical protein n=1 Tax=Burkholderia stabilis TaxID=95485 RepID=UPI001F4AB7F7|nr:hypothetical protein [Burkholderia stabilis]
MSEAATRPDDGGRFINLWELFAQIGKAEAIYGYEAAREFASCLSNDPVGMNFIRRRDELGILCPIDIDGRLRLLQLLNLFGSQGTLFDEDGIPNDDAQPTFGRFGFYASDIYPFLARHDVAISRPGDDAVNRVFPDGRRIPGWILAYDGQAWIRYGRAVGILTASTVAAERHSPDHDDVHDRWGQALSDAVACGAIRETTVSGKRMLAHADVRTWFAQQGHAWPLEAPEAQPDNEANAVPPTGQQVQQAQSLSGTPGEHDGGMTRREQQIRAIEAMADKEKYPRQQIPDGGKTKLRDLCKAEHPALFGAGDSPFDDAWKAASKADRIAMANRNKFTGR